MLLAATGPGYDGKEPRHAGPIVARA